MESKQDKLPGGERFKKMAVRLATHLSLLDIDEWDDLPPHYQSFFLNLRYRDIIAPLVRHDYKCFISGKSKFQSAAQIALKYGIHRNALTRLIKDGR